jgi:hypothetical protein
MVEQLLSNTNEMLQCAIMLNGEFGNVEFGQLNMAQHACLYATTYVSGPQSGAHDVAVSWIRPRTRNLRSHVRTPSLSSIRAGRNACVAVLGMSPAYIRTCPCIYILCSPCCCYQSKYSTTTCSVTARSSVHQQIRDNVRTLF